MSRVILIGTIFVLLSTMSFGQSKRTWEKTKTLNTITGYENFIKKYPDKKYTALAKQNLEELTFSIVKEENTIESYESFLQQWKNSSYTSEANKRLDELYFNKAEAEGAIQSYESFLQHRKNSSYTFEANKRLDDLYFNKAEAEGTIPSYESFLQHRKNSSYTSEANKRLSILYMERDWIKTIETNEIIEYERFLRQYANSPHIQEAIVRKQLLGKQWDELEGLLKKGSVQSLKDYCKKNYESPYLPKARAAIQDMEGGRDIVDLLDDGKIEIKTQGQGIETVSVSIRKLVPYPITVRVPVGSFFVPASELVQDMVTTAQCNVLLSGNDWQTVTVSAACANRAKAIPRSYHSFTIQRSPHQDELARLLPALDKAGVNFATRQAAVWIVTDNADYSDLGELVIRSQAAIFGGARVINEVAAAHAMKICSDAGIDIYSKLIWSDRQVIFAGLEDDKLKKIIKDLQAEEATFRAKLQAEEPAARAKLKAFIEWATIPAGTFTMGSPPSEVGREAGETKHLVTLAAFKMSKYEVTFEQYDLFCNATGRGRPNDAGWGRGKRPVINVSWNDAVAFADWMGCRLPTEAEWEYACRAGTKTPFNTGDNLTTLQANYNGNYPYSNNAKGEGREKTMLVGSFSPNAWGLYDMHGNVWEWCSDWYDDYSTGAQNDPKGPATGSFRVFRGGSWINGALRCRSAFRINFGSPVSRNGYMGFRLVSPE